MSIKPPFTLETAHAMVQAAEDAWNTRDADQVSLKYAEHAEWRNRTEFIDGREAIRAFLRRKWSKELDYRLKKTLWGFRGNRMAVSFEYEWHDDGGQWFRSYGVELWEFDDDGLMRRRLASINDAPIRDAERRIASRGIVDPPRLLNQPLHTDPPTAPSDRRDQNDAAAKGTDPAPVSRGAVWARWAPIPLRLIVGLGFMAHGVAKLSRGADVFAATLQGLGVPSPDLAAWSTIVVELLGGLAVAVGAFVPLASIPMAVVLLVAIVTVHLPYGFSSIKLIAVTDAGPQFGKPGYETALLYLACLATLLLGGPGAFAVDNKQDGEYEKHNAQ